MNQPLEFFVIISAPSGQPEDLRVIKKPHWTGQGFIFSRSVFADKILNREELNHTGVYVLWGSSGTEQLPRAYIGEGDVLLPRLNSHLRDKGFWTHGAAFISEDQSLNKAHVQHLEARLLQFAKDAKRCKLTNTNTPRKSSLSTMDMEVAEQYLTDMLQCLSIVGVNFFDKPREPTKTNQDFFLSGKNIKAHGFEDKPAFVVRAGSQAVKNEAKKIPARYSKLREELLDQGIFEDTGTEYQLVQDYRFKSPSAAAGVLLGSSRNGLTTWKDVNGRSLKEIQKAEVETMDESDEE